MDVKDQVVSFNKNKLLKILWWFFEKLNLSKISITPRTPNKLIDIAKGPKCLNSEPGPKRNINTNKNEETKIVKTLIENESFR